MVCTSYPDVQVGTQNNNFGAVSQIGYEKFGSVCACAGDGYSHVKAEPRSNEKTRRDGVRKRMFSLCLL